MLFRSTTKPEQKLQIILYITVANNTSGIIFPITFVLGGITTAFKGYQEFENAKNKYILRNFLLQDGKVDINKIHQEITNVSVLTPLFLGSVQGHTEIVKSLLETKADVNAIVNLRGKHYTPLMAAKEMMHTEIIEILKKAGARE